MRTRVHICVFLGVSFLLPPTTEDIVWVCYTSCLPKTSLRCLLGVVFTSSLFHKSYIFPFYGLLPWSVTPGASWKKMYGR